MAEQTKVFEHIEVMTEQFWENFDPQDGRNNAEVRFGQYWEMRINLAIAQQLSVIAGQLKKLNDDAPWGAK